MHTFQEMLAAIAAGRAGVVYVPMPDGPRCRWTFVWRADPETELIRAFAAVAGDFAASWAVPGAVADECVVYEA